jgi:hypothetical protein
MRLLQRIPRSFRALTAAFALALLGQAISSAMAADAALEIHIVADGHHAPRSSAAQFTCWTIGARSTN